MTKEERQELTRIKQMRGRYEPETEQGGPQYKDIKKTHAWQFRLFGRIIEIRVTNPNK